MLVVSPGRFSYKTADYDDDDDVCPKVCGQPANPLIYHIPETMCINPLLQPPPLFCFQALHQILERGCEGFAPVQPRGALSEAGHWCRVIRPGSLGVWTHPKTVGWAWDRSRQSSPCRPDSESIFLSCSVHGSAVMARNRKRPCATQLEARHCLKCNSTVVEVRLQFKWN